MGCGSSVASVPSTRYQAPGSTETDLEQHVRHEANLKQLLAAVEGNAELSKIVTQLQADATGLTTSASVRAQQLKTLQADQQSSASPAPATTPASSEPSAELATLERQLREAKAKLEAHDATNIETSTKLAAAEDFNAAALCAVKLDLEEQLQTKLGNLQQKLMSAHQSELSALQDEVKQGIAEQKAAAAMLEQTVSDKEAEIANKEAEIAKVSAKSEALELTVSSLKNSSAVKESALKTAQSDFDDAMGIANQWGSKVKSLESKLAEVNSSLENSVDKEAHSRELAAVQVELGQAQHAKEAAAASVESLCSTVDEKEKEIEENRAKLLELESTVDVLHCASREMEANFKQSFTVRRPKTSIAGMRPGDSVLTAEEQEGIVEKVSQQVKHRALARQSLPVLEPKDEPGRRGSAQERKSIARGNSTINVVVDSEQTNNYQRTLKLNDPPTVKEFDLLTEIGEGMSATVWAGEHIESSTLVALKALKKSNMPTTGKMFKYVKEEKRILQEMSHPFIITLIAAFQDKLNLYMVLEYVPGGDFFTFMNDRANDEHEGHGQTISEEDATVYGAELVLALGHLHSHKIVYRDLKPENVLMDRNGHVCLTDFGLSKSMGFEKNGRLHSFVGTPDYLAPEVLMHSGHSYEVDWWALGVMLCEMVDGIGNTPFYADEDSEVSKNIMTGKPQLPPDSSPSFVSLLNGLLSKIVVVRLGSEKKGGTKGIQDHEWFKAIDWSNLSSYRRSDESCAVAAPWKPTEDLQHDTVLKKMRSKKKVAPTSPKNKNVFEQWGSYVAPDALHKSLSTTEMGEMTALLVSPLLDGSSTQVVEDALAGVLDADASFIMNGSHYDGISGLLEYHETIKARFADVETAVQSVHLVKAHRGVQELHLEFEMTAVYRVTGMNVNMTGAVMVTITDGKLVKGMISVSLLDAVEKHMNSSWEGGQSLNVQYAALQMQLDKALGHLQAICSDVRSVIRANVEDVFSLNVVMFDPRFHALLVGHDEMVVALGGLSRLYEKRTYKILGLRFETRENGNQIIELDVIFHSVCRTDVRTMATFKKLRRYPVAEGTEAREIVIPITLKMEFNGLKCVKIDRMYQLMFFLDQLGGTMPPEVEISLGSSPARLEYEAALFVDPDALDKQRREATARYIEASYPIDMEKFNTFATECLLDNVKLMDVSSGERGTILKALSEAPEEESVDVKLLLRNTSGVRCVEDVTMFDRLSNPIITGKEQVCSAFHTTSKVEQLHGKQDRTSETEAEFDNDVVTITSAYDFNVCKRMLPDGAPAVVCSQNSTTQLTFQPHTAKIKEIWIRKSQSQILESVGLAKTGSAMAFARGSFKSVTDV